jgi:hypothetical protein
LPRIAQQPPCATTRRQREQRGHGQNHASGPSRARRWHGRRTLRRRDLHLLLPSRLLFPAHANLIVPIARGKGRLYRPYWVSKRAEHGQYGRPFDHLGAYRCPRQPRAHASSRWCIVVQNGVF